MVARLGREAVLGRGLEAGVACLLLIMDLYLLPPAAALTKRRRSACTRPLECRLAVR